MRRLMVAAFAVLAACSQGAAGWPEEERVAFIENCERTSDGRSEFCRCMLERVEDRHPDIDDAEDLSVGELQGLAGDCPTG